MCFLLKIVVKSVGMKKLAIFDNDGTLVDTEKPMWNEAEKKGLIATGYEPTPELLNNIIGKSMKNNWEMLANRFPGFPNEKFWKIVYQEVDNYIKFEKVIIMPGVVELLECLKKNNVTCAVASSSNMDQINGMMDNTGLNKYFDKIFSAAELKQGKPNPEIYLNVLDYYKIDKKDAIVFEDSHNGALAAINAGIDVVIIPSNSIITDEDRQKALRIYKRIDEAIELFQ